MEDRKIKKLVQFAKKLKLREEKLKKELALIGVEKDKIRDYLEKEGVDKVESGGVSITYVAPEPLDFDEKLLKRYLSTKMYSAVTKTVLDKPALAYQISKGKISKELVAKCSSVKDVKSYVLINLPKED